MCGIAGFSGYLNIEDKVIDNTLALMQTRGPDANGVNKFTSKQNINTLLLHSRLSILDLEDRAKQPFVIDNQAISYNGELYNYLELKQELEEAGVKFHTTSDTEVLLAAINNWGLDAALNKFEGMWAFALYNKITGELTLCRDRFNEKPLYYFLDGANNLYFGSEIKYIKSLYGKRINIDYQHLARYLVNGYKSLYKSRSNFFVGINQVPAATVIKFNQTTGIRQYKYWDFKVAVDTAMSYEQAVRGVYSRLKKSMQQRLRSDVPIAFCMSGGVDSNSLISLAKREFNYDVHGFTISNTDKRYEEESLIDLSAKKLGIRHTKIELKTAGFIDRLKDLVKYHDSPVYTISYYLHSLLMQSVKAAGYKISVSGTAADELFSGYYDHHLAYLYDLRDDKLKFKQAELNWQQHIAPIVRNPHLQDSKYYIKAPFARHNAYLDKEYFASFLTKPFNESFKEEFYTDSLLKNRMLNELFTETIPVILHEDDHNAMQYSIENRSPFLDRDLFEFSLTIPTEYFIQDGFTKSVLRDAMRDTLEPEIVNSRRKVGFNAPILDLIDVEKEREYLLADSPVFEILDKAKLTELLAYPELKNSQSKFLFNFINTKMFLEEFA